MVNQVSKRANFASARLPNSKTSFQVAIDWLTDVPDDDLNDFLPQLLEALKNETWSELFCLFVITILYILKSFLICEF